ncbi:MAG: ABC transporter permease [Lachnospiraceae bacterium]|nr:ABC transporter permease [Lachnospiraceae bacterium]
MFRFVIRKMLNKKWMMIALLVGNILLVAIAAASAMYTETSLQRTLSKELKNYIADYNRYPLTYSVKTSTLRAQGDYIRGTTEKMRNSGMDFRLPVLYAIEVFSNLSTPTTSDMDREDRSDTLTVGGMSGLEDHIRIIEGSGLSEGFREDGTVDLIVSEQGYQSMRLLLGEVITFEKYIMPDGQPLRGRIAGVFKAADENDFFWVRSPNRYDKTIFMQYDLFHDLFMAEGMENVITADWYTLYDYKALEVSNVGNVLDTAQEYHAYFKTLKDGLLDAQRGSDNFEELLTNFQKTEKKVRTTFLVLQAPIYVLLALFIFMVSKQIVNMEESEIAVLKSRGAGKRQILFVYLLQSLLMEIIAVAIGLPLAWLLTYVLGSANAFLEFVYRKDLQVVLTPKSLYFAGAAVLFSILTMVIPAFRYSGTTIVNHKQRKHKRSETPFWHRFFLDFVLLGVSIYGLYTFNNQKAILTERVLSGESLDPLLFISSSLFMIGAGLLMLRLIPLIEKLIFRIFRNKWSPALYTSFLQVIRTRKSQGFIMVFLVMTIALGVFNASAARTVNENDERNLRYLNGADIVIQEKWQDNGELVAEDSSLELEFYEPDYGRFKSLEGNQAESVTKVYINKAGTVSLKAGSLRNVTVMGIDTKEFGKTAWFDESLISPHWYNYLNALGQKSRAVLVSSNFKNYGYKLNDTIYFYADGNNMLGVIYGFVDFWPSYSRKSYQKDSDGVFKEIEKYTIITNLSQMQATWGIRPYQVWMKTKGDSSFIYDLKEEKQLQFTGFKDTAADYVAHKNDAVLQGTNGILTVGFITALLLCTVGFLIYWITSVRQRELQFGIFRAMGMSMREIIVMLLNEHIFISGASILSGALVGRLTARLFMPLIQIAYSSSENALPLEIISDPTDSVRLAVIIGGMVILCLIVIGVIIRRMKIAQALKLGED